MEDIRTFGLNHLAVLKQEGFLIKERTKEEYEKMQRKQKRTARRSNGGNAPRYNPEIRGKSVYEYDVYPPFAKVTSNIFRKLIKFCIKGDLIGLNQCLQIEGDYRLVKSLLRSGARDEITGYTAYEFACIQGNVEIVRRLLGIEKQRAVFGRAIEFSIMTDNLQLMQLFKSTHTQRCFRYFFSKELYFALKYNRKRIIEFLMTDKNFDVNAIDYARCFSALDYASQNGDIDIVKWLIENGANPNIKDEGYKKAITPLRLAAKGGNSEIVKLLIDHGAKVIIEDSSEKILKIMQRIKTAENGSKCNMRDAEVITKILQIEILQERHKSVYNSGDNSIEETLISKKRKLAEFLAEEEEEMLPRSKRRVIIKSLNEESLITDIESLNEASNDEPNFQKDMNDLCGTLKHKVQKLEQENKDKDAHNSQLKEELKKAKVSQSLIDQSMNDIAKKEETINKLKAEIEELKAEKNSVRSLHIAAEEKVIQLQEEVNKLKSSFEDGSNTIPSNPDESANILQPLKQSFLGQKISFNGKMTYLSAIDSILSRNPAACKFVTEKEIIDQIADLVENITSRVDDDNGDLHILARILAKIECAHDGKKLIGSMKMTFDASVRLRTEMKKVKIAPNPNAFEFDSDKSVPLKKEFPEIYLD